MAVLTDINFVIESGSTCAIIGPSGSGKTTLIAICAGLERATQGSVLLNGVAVTPPAKKNFPEYATSLSALFFRAFSCYRH